jgi:cell division protein FtsQ
MLFVGFWLAIGAGVLVLLVAAIRNRKEKSCTGYEITLSDKGDQWFMNKKEVVDILTGNGAVALKGKALERFDLRSMEERLRKNVWIRDAELFFDNNEVLQVKIEEREPIARLFTVTGNSFYIDSSCERLPLSDKLSAKLPVFTNFPTDKLRLSSADSLLMQHIKQVSVFIHHDAFWNAQIAQVDITPDRRFEMIPTVGNHVIDFGDGTNFDKKFARLLQFYKLVLSKTGMDVYKRVNVQYDRQVVGVKSGGGMTRYDSLLAARSAQQLIATSQSLLSDSINSQAVVQHASLSSVNSSPAKKTDTEKPSIPAANEPRRTSSTKVNPPAKSQSYGTSSKPLPKKPVTKTPVKKQPKAVMPKKKNNN